jgi:hypothetical protein
MSELGASIAQTFGDLIGLPVVGLAGRLLLIALTVIWIATAWWAWRDMENRGADLLLRLLATAGIVLATPFLFPLAVVIYMILRPPYREEGTRNLEVRLAELEIAAGPDRCPHCHARTVAGWQRCPACGQVLTVACPACGEPVGLDWQLCAWCASELPWTAPPEEEERRPERPAVAIPIVPGGRPMVPVMAVPEDEQRFRQPAPVMRPRRKPVARPRG